MTMLNYCYDSLHGLSVGVDTTAAMVGGIIASYAATGPGGVPASWLASGESLPAYLRLPRVAPSVP